MNDSKLFIHVSTLFILLGLTLPFYLPSDWGLLPLGMSFLADGIILLLFGLVGYFLEAIEKARREDELQRWLKARDNFDENNYKRKVTELE